MLQSGPILFSLPRTAAPPGGCCQSRLLLPRGRQQRRARRPTRLLGGEAQRRPGAPAGGVSARCLLVTPQRLPRLARAASGGVWIIKYCVSPL